MLGRSAGDGANWYQGQIQPLAGQTLGIGTFFRSTPRLWALGTKSFQHHSLPAQRVSQREETLIKWVGGGGGGGVLWCASIKFGGCFLSSLGEEIQVPGLQQDTQVPAPAEGKELTMLWAFPPPNRENDICQTPACTCLLFFRVKPWFFLISIYLYVNALTLFGTAMPSSQLKPVGNSPINKLVPPLKRSLALQQSQSPGKQNHVSPSSLY